MKHLTTIVLLLLSVLCSAQPAYEKVDRNDILRKISDKTAPTYYQTLLARYNAFDTTLSDQDFRLLYYGFVFQPEYSPYPSLKQKEINQFMKDENYAAVSKTCDTVLAKFPVNLNANYYKGLALYMMNNSDPEYENYGRRFYRLLGAIVKSGDGLTCGSAFKTICVNDEYQVIYKYFLIDQVLGQTLQTPCDRMSVQPSRMFSASSMYFDTSETLNALKNMLGN